jgi:hypothetical protein
VLLFPTTLALDHEPRLVVSLLPYTVAPELLPSEDQSPTPETVRLDASPSGRIERRIGPDTVDDICVRMCHCRIIWSIPVRPREHHDNLSAGADKGRSCHAGGDGGTRLATVRNIDAPITRGAMFVFPL